MKFTIAGCRRLLTLTIVFSAVSPGSAGSPELGDQARAVLKEHCSRCHGPESPGKGGMNYILDREHLVSRRKLIPLDSARSPIFQRMAKKEMPPAGVKPRPAADELGVLKQWIDAGAPAANTPLASRQFMTEADVVYLISADLEKLPARQRRFTRYFTLTNLTNAGRTIDVLAVQRQALCKLLNSLSWHPRIALPQPVNEDQNVLRIDLRDIQWNALSWNRILNVYPYRISSSSPELKAIATATGCDLPFVRADWFVANGARPPLYHDLLLLPVTDRELERQLRVDVLLDIQEDRVARSGFNGSGVAKNNRLLERHDAAFGSYWRSYDFASNTEQQNLFNHPLGPQPGQNSFEHAGGEIIFNLPNGLQGYMLVDANGRRLERAPIEIVSDPRRPDRFVETGISCMSCHTQGIIHKADQVRAHVLKNPTAFSPADVDLVKALYPSEDHFKRLVDEDARRYRQAAGRTGAKETEVEAIVSVALGYEGEMDLSAAAGESGLKPGEFSERLHQSAVLTRILGPLNVAGGTIQRQVFEEQFPEIVREMHLSDAPSRVVTEGLLSQTVNPRAPFAGHTGHVLGIAWSPDGNRVITGSEDRTLRLWDVASGREIRTLEGHTDEVLAVAFSPDNRQALSGGRDRTVRLWDLISGKEIRCLIGHTERVSSVQFSCDGHFALSGSWDQTVSLWDLEKGKELLRLGGHTGYISGVAFSPDGQIAVSGSYDGTVRLWDLKTGQEIRTLAGPNKEVYCVAFAPDGRQVAAGSNDHNIYVWEAKTGKLLRQLEGHDQAVIQVRYSADGQRLISGSSQYQDRNRNIRIWAAADGRLLQSYGGSAEETWAIAFSPDCRRALSSNSKMTLRRWELPR